MGGKVRRGEHACPVVFWKWLDVDDASEQAGKRRVPMLRYYSVFNVAQCEGVTAPAIEGADRPHNPIETAEQIVAAMPKRPAVRHGSVHPHQNRAHPPSTFNRPCVPVPRGASNH